MSLNPALARLVADARARKSIDQPLVHTFDRLTGYVDQMDEIRRLLEANRKASEANKVRFEKKERQLADLREHLEARFADLSKWQDELRKTLRTDLMGFYEQDEDIEASEDELSAV